MHSNVMSPGDSLLHVKPTRHSVKLQINAPLSIVVEDKKKCKIYASVLPHICTPQKIVSKADFISVKSENNNKKKSVREVGTCPEPFCKILTVCIRGVFGNTGQIAPAKAMHHTEKKLIQ